MFLLDTETIVASGLGTVMLFLIYRAYSIWKKWSKKSRLDDEIAIDRRIAEAIKNGDVLLLAKLKKYYQIYANQKKRAPETGESSSPPNEKTGADPTTESAPDP